jgi:hypothetical protein
LKIYFIKTIKEAEERGMAEATYEDGFDNRQKRKTKVSKYSV